MSVRGDVIRWEFPKRFERNAAIFETAGTMFWQETEKSFYSTLKKARDVLRGNGDLQSIKEKWVSDLVKESERIFDEFSQYDQIGAADPRRIALARRDLVRFNSLRSSRIRGILDLPNEDNADDRVSPGETA